MIIHHWDDAAGRMIAIEEQGNEGQQEEPEQDQADARSNRTARPARDGVQERPEE